MPRFTNLESKDKSGSDYRLVLEEWFDIEKAEWEYKYTLYKWQRVGIYPSKKQAYRPVIVDTYGGKQPASGNEKWAKRIAEEYKINVPKRKLGIED